MSSLSVIAYWTVFGASWATLRRMIERHHGNEAVPASTLWPLLVWCAVAVPSFAQLAVPGLLAAGERSTDAIRHGQMWRLLTAIFLQDGGLPGTLSNLAVLAVTLLLVRRLLPGPLITVLFLAGGVIANALTAATFAQTGAGNSMATMFLATASITWFAPGSRDRSALSGLAIIGIAGLVLLARRDSHGIAVVAGLLAGLIGRRLGARRAS